MHFAKDNDSTKFFAYHSLIKDLLNANKKNKQLKGLFDEIIISTHKLVVEEVAQDEVDHKIYDIVIALADFNKPYTRDFFKNVNIKKITHQDYETLNSILSSILSAPSF